MLACGCSSLRLWVGAWLAGVWEAPFFALDSCGSPAICLRSSYKWLWLLLQTFQPLWETAACRQNCIRLAWISLSGNKTRRDFCCKRNTGLFECLTWVLLYSRDTLISCSCSCFASSVQGADDAGRACKC